MQLGKGFLKIFANKQKDIKHISLFKIGVRYRDLDIIAGIEP